MELSYVVPSESSFLIWRSLVLIYAFLIVLIPANLEFGKVFIFLCFLGSNY
jgi:hypothetical protein